MYCTPRCVYIYSKSRKISMCKILMHALWFLQITIDIIIEIHIRIHENILENSTMKKSLIWKMWPNNSLRCILKGACVLEVFMVHSDVVVTMKRIAWWWLSHLTLDKIFGISRTTYSDAFSWLKIFVFCFEFHRGLFIVFQLTIS